jgi:hypothetical protein
MEAKWVAVIWLGICGVIAIGAIVSVSSELDPIESCARACNQYPGLRIEEGRRMLRYSPTEGCICEGGERDAGSEVG